jgi:hypothetical protein
MDLHFRVSENRYTECLEREFGEEDGSWLGSSVNNPDYNRCHSLGLNWAGCFTYISINPYNSHHL